MPEAPPIKGLYHFAFPCRDAEETRAFYEEILGLPLVHCMQVDAVPSSGEKGPYAHIFFEMGDGSYIAFFDLGHGRAPTPMPDTPRWVQHFAMEVASIDEVEAMRNRLKAAGIEVVGLVDHDFIRSIYFFDPNGLRLEVTARTETQGFLDRARGEAHGLLRDWTAFKRARADTAAA